MDQEFTSKIGYLAEKEGTEKILKRSIPQTLQCDMETREYLKMLALPEKKDTYHQK